MQILSTTKNNPHHAHRHSHTQSDRQTDRQHIFYFIKYFILLSIWVTPGNAPGLHLALDLGITPDGARGTKENAEDQIWVDCCKARALPTVLSL